VFDTCLTHSIIIISFFVFLLKFRRSPLTTSATGKNKGHPNSILHYHWIFS